MGMSYDGAAYADQLEALLPSGRAWNRAPGGLLDRLRQAIGAAFARVDGRAAQLLDEDVPTSALELLPDWERVVGLPDPCNPETGSIRERQTAIARKLGSLGGQSIAFLVDLAARVGFTIEIGEFEPGSCADDCTMLIGDDAWAHVFEVEVIAGSAISETFLTTLSGCDEALRSFGSTTLECVINRVRPAHSIVVFSYPE